MTSVPPGRSCTTLGIFMPEIACHVMGAGAARTHSSGLATPAEHAAHQLGGAADAGLAQDVGAVAFDGARAQSEGLRDFLGTLAGRDPFQHFPFAAAEMQPVAEIGGDAGAAVRYFAERSVDARDDIAAVERLCDEIE